MVIPDRHQRAAARHQPRRHPPFWIPQLNGKRDAVPGRVHTLRLEADQPGIYAGQCTEFCGLVARQHAHGGRRPRRRADFETWKANQLAPYAAPRGGHAGRRRARQTFIAAVLALPPGQRPASTPTATPVDRPARALRVRRGGAEPHPPDDPQHVRRRDVRPARPRRAATACGTRRPRSSARSTCEGVTPECLNEVDLREWLRNAPAKKPMYTDPSELRTDRRQVPRHAEPRPHRGPDRPARRLPARAEVMERLTMAIIERPIPGTSPRRRRRRRRHAVARRYGVFRRPVSHHRLAVVAVHGRPQEARHHVRRRGACSSSSSAASRRC